MCATYMMRSFKTCTNKNVEQTYNLTPILECQLTISPGSAIGPLLFLLFVNHLPSAITMTTLLFTGDFRFISFTQYFFARPLNLVAMFFLRSGAKTQNRQYGQWVLRSNERTQGKETFNIYELNSHERQFIRNMGEFQSNNFTATRVHERRLTSQIQVSACDLYSNEKVFTHKNGEQKHKRTPLQLTISA